MSKYLFFVGLLLAVQCSAMAGPSTRSGGYRIEITTDPAVVPVGKANLLIKISDAAGQPASGLQVRAITKMPGMPMGEQEEPALPQPGQPGTYTVPAQFPMAGGYEADVKITGPAGPIAGSIPLQTGEDTASSQSGGPWSTALPWAVGVLALAFLLYRISKSGGRPQWRKILNAQVASGLLLLALMLAVSLYAVHRYRRAGAMTPIEAQSMEMEMPAPPGTLPVELATVQRGPISSSVRYSGQAVGFIEQAVYPRVQGVITWMPFYVGDRVTRGQLLARLDTSQYLPQVAQSEAAAAQAQAGTAIARTQYRQALGAQDQAEAEVGMKSGAVEDTRSQVAKARAELASRQAALLDAGSQQQKARAAFKEAQISVVGAKGALAAARADADAAVAERESAEADATAADTQIADAQAQLQTAQANQAYWSKEIERMRELVKAGVSARKDLEREGAQSEDADAKVRQAQARIAQTQAVMQSARAMERKAAAMAGSASAKASEAQAAIEGSESRVAQAQDEMDATQARVGQAAADVEAARAGIASSLARVEQAQSELHAHHAHVNQMDAAVTVAQQQIGQAEAGSDMARAAAQSAATTLGYTEIRSQIDGIVTKRNISPGVLVGPGQAILEIAQVSPLRIQANVAQSDLERIAVGSPVIIGSDAKATPVSARITSIAPSVDPIARTGVAEAVLPNLDNRFVPGQYLVMDISIGRHVDALHIPTRAVHWHAAAGAESAVAHAMPFVWVAASQMGQDGPWSVHEVAVKLGMTSGNDTEILSGLLENQRVVASAEEGLRDGDAVAPEGEAVAPEGEAVAPEGEAVAPEGDADAPEAVGVQGETP